MISISRDTDLLDWGFVCSERKMGIGIMRKGAEDFFLFFVGKKHDKVSGFTFEKLFNVLDILNSPLPHIEARRPVMKTLLHNIML